MMKAGITIGCCLGMLLCFCADAAGQTSDAAWEAWPELNAYTGLRQGLRLLLSGQSLQGLNLPHEQWMAQAEIAYQLKPIVKPHVRNINPDKEHHLVLAASYEYLRTTQPGKTTLEDRAMIDVTYHYRFGAPILLADRNRVEFRWVDGEYSTRYRNRLTVEHDFQAHSFRITPYASIEVFYDGKHHSWNEAQYAFGVQLPYKRLLMLDTYYLRQDCSTCSTNPLNIWGLALNIYFRNTK